MYGRRDYGSGQLVAGLALIALGAIFLLDRFHMFHIGWMISRFWPSALIFIGVMQILNGRTRSLTGPMVLIAIGALFQADRLRLFDWRFSQMWPVILIVIGVALLAERMRRASAGPGLPSGGPPNSAPQGHTQV